MRPVSPSAVDEPRLLAARHRRLAATMTAAHILALLTADPSDIAYACGARNMTVFGMMGPSRFVLVFAEGPTILYEFAGVATDSARDHIGEPTVQKPAPTAHQCRVETRRDGLATSLAEMATVARPDPS